MAWHYLNDIRFRYVLGSGRFCQASTLFAFLHHGNLVDDEITSPLKDATTEPCDVNVSDSIVRPSIRDVNGRCEGSRRDHVTAAGDAAFTLLALQRQHANINCGTRLLLLAFNFVATY